jgi:hypothetical protein
VKVLEYGTVVEVVFQDTGIRFYVVGRGSGIFDANKDRPPTTWRTRRTRTPSPCQRPDGLQSVSGLRILVSKLGIRIN